MYTLTMVVGSSLRLIACAALYFASGTAALSIVVPRTNANAHFLCGWRQRVLCSAPNHFSPYPMAVKTTLHATTMASTDEGTTTIERPETVEKVKDEGKVQKDEKLGSEGWMVRLYNDPMNKREFVARCLTEICGLSDGAAYDTMMQAHLNGLAVIGRYMYERAEMYYTSLREHGLFVDMVPVEDD